MSDFLKKLKGIFVEDMPNDGKKVAASAPPPVSQPISVVSNPISSIKGEADERFMEMLLTAMNAANMEGFDYVEYKQSIKNLQHMPMDEATRFKSAFAMAQTMGATKEKLQQSAAHYLTVLQQEANKFTEAANRQRSQQVGTKETERENLDVNIKQKRAQIEQLNREIGEHEQALAQIKDQITEATAKVDITVADFSASYERIKRQIENDVNSINNYI